MFTTKSLIAAAAAAATLAAMPAAAQADAVRYAHTPSGNITCRANRSPVYGWSLVCTVADPGLTMRISDDGYAYESAYKRIAKRGRTLEYGHVYTLGDFRCESTESELTCSRDRDEGYLLLSRENSSAVN